MFNPLNNCFSECFNIAGGSVAGINQKVAVDVGDFGAADPQIGTAGFFNEFPSFETFGVFESGTAGAGVAGLAFQTICLLLVQFLFIVSGASGCVWSVSERIIQSSGK